MRSKNRSTTRGSVIEVLESRRLLSASPVAGVATPALFIVGPVVPPTSTTIILHERAGVAFTASLGTFVTIAPATNLQASITWGDGTSSAGTLTPLGVVGLDEVKFEVDGTHTYRKAGRFPIQVTVVQPGPTPTTLVRLIATLHDRALVTEATTLLNGTISGTYSLAPTSVELGGGYVFNGTGTAGDLGAVSAHGLVTLPSLVATATGQATGTLTLTQTRPERRCCGQQFGHAETDRPHRVKPRRFPGDADLHHHRRHWRICQRIGDGFDCRDARRQYDLQHDDYLLPAAHRRVDAWMSS